MTQAPAGTNSTGIEVTSSSDPFVRRILVALLLLGFAAWTFFDFYVAGKYDHLAGSKDWNDLASYLLNRYGVFVLAPPGLAIVVLALVLRARRLVADERGIGYAGKPPIAWGEITSVDATLLAGKGLMTIHYGQGRKLKLDSYNFRDFKSVAAYIEQRVPAEKIAK